MCENNWLTSDTTMSTWSEQSPQCVISGGWCHCRTEEILFAYFNWIF